MGILFLLYSMQYCDDNKQFSTLAKYCQFILYDAFDIDDMCAPSMRSERKRWYNGNQVYSTTDVSLILQSLCNISRKE